MIPPAAQIGSWIFTMLPTRIPHCLKMLSLGRNSTPKLPSWRNHPFSLPLSGISPQIFYLLARFITASLLPRWNSDDEQSESDCEMLATARRTLLGGWEGARIEPWKFPEPSQTFFPFPSFILGVPTPFRGLENLYKSLVTFCHNWTCKWSLIYSLCDKMWPHPAW